MFKCGKKMHCNDMSITDCMVHVPNGQPEDYLKENRQLKAILANKRYKERLRLVLTRDYDEIIELDKVDLSQAIVKTKTWFEGNIAYSNKFDQKTLKTNLSTQFRFALATTVPRMSTDRGMTIQQTREVLLFWIAFYSVL
jgi:hypothetical protein